MYVFGIVTNTTGLTSYVTLDPGATKSEGSATPSASTTTSGWATQGTTTATGTAVSTSTVIGNGQNKYVPIVATGDATVNAVLDPQTSPTTDVTVTVTIPAGIDSDNRLRIAGKGAGGTNGGDNGDLYIEFTVREHEYFQRADDDIYIELPLTITEAALGTKKEIPTLYGNVDLTIPAGTQTGEKMRLAGKGVENISTKKKGNMYVITKVIVTEKLSRTQKQLLEELSETDLEPAKYFKTYKNCIK